MFEVSSTVREIETAFFFIFGVSAVFLLGITFVMVWFVIRYNRKRHPVAADIEGNLPLEILWTAIPTLLALGMFYYGWLGFDTLRNVPRGALRVEATGRMFDWNFKYESGRQTRELHLPVGKPVHLILKSADVNHSFYVSAFKIKQDCIPGQENYIAFTPLREGVYDIQCAEFCGTGHSAMLTRLIAMPAKEFDLWLKKTTAQKPLDMQAALAGSAKQLERGERVYQLHCSACHDPQGKGTGVANARNFTTRDGWKNGSKIAQIYRTLNNGLGDKMPAFQHLQPDDRFAVIHYVRRFASGHPADAPTEIGALDAEFSLTKGKMPKPELPIPEAMARLAQAPTAADARPTLSGDALFALRQTAPRGAALFAANCARCHGDRGQGGRMVHTLDEAWDARVSALALNVPGRPWRAQDAEALSARIGKTSISTGGLKPAFGAFSKADWAAVHRFILGLSPARND